jgi:hypothetical protein
VGGKGTLAVLAHLLICGELLQEVYISFLQVRYAYTFLTEITVIILPYKQY